MALKLRWVGKTGQWVIWEGGIAGRKRGKTEEDAKKREEEEEEESGDRKRAKSHRIKQQRQNKGQREERKRRSRTLGEYRRSLGDVSGKVERVRGVSSCPTLGRIREDPVAPALDDGRLWRILIIVGRAGGFGGRGRFGGMLPALT